MILVFFLGAALGIIVGFTLGACSCEEPDPDDTDPVTGPF